MGRPSQIARTLCNLLLLDFERAGRRLTTEAAREGWSACHSTGSSVLVASRGSASVCSDLGLERWWPDPASVEHAREVGLLPEVRIA